MAWPRVPAADLEHLVPGLLTRPDGTITADGGERRCAAYVVACAGLRRGLGYWLKMVGADDVDSSRGMQFDTLISTLRMAELGQGIALARSSMVDEMLQDGRLIEPFDQRIEASESFYLVRGSGQTQHPDATTFSTWLVEQAHRYN